MINAWLYRPLLFTAIAILLVAGTNLGPSHAADKSLFGTVIAECCLSSVEYLLSDEPDSDDVMPQPRMWLAIAPRTTRFSAFNPSAALAITKRITGVRAPPTHL